MAKSFAKLTWVNDTTPVNADNLNRIEQGIYDAIIQGNTNENAIDELESRCDTITTNMAKIRQENEEELVKIAKKGISQEFVDKAIAEQINQTVFGKVCRMANYTTWSFDVLGGTDKTDIIGKIKASDTDDVLFSATNDIKLSSTNFEIAGSGEADFNINALFKKDVVCEKALNVIGNSKFKGSLSVQGINGDRTFVPYFVINIAVGTAGSLEWNTSEIKTAFEAIRTYKCSGTLILAGKDTSEKNYYRYCYLDYFGEDTIGNYMIFISNNGTTLKVYETESENQVQFLE